MDHARGFSESCTILWWSTHQASVEAAWVWGCRWVLEPAAKFLRVIGRNSGIFVSWDGILHRCTNHDPRRGGISVTWLSRVRGLMFAAATLTTKGGQRAQGTRRGLRVKASKGSKGRVPENDPATSPARFPALVTVCQPTAPPYQLNPTSDCQTSSIEVSIVYSKLM